MFSNIANSILFTHIVDILRFVDTHQWLTIQMNLHNRLFLRIKSERELIKSGCNSNDACLTLLPEEIVGTSVKCLYFPRDHIIGSLHLT